MLPGESTSGVKMAAPARQRMREERRSTFRKDRRSPIKAAAAKMAPPSPKFMCPLPKPPLSMPPAPGIDQNNCRKPDHPGLVSTAGAKSSPEKSLESSG